ncbi:hypothetical protein ZYGR_0AD01170 [Zygosaccharomyces rouxii]|uniref:Oxidation resistance protein 1 n=2 Tax=Zygosaccharomyces rouxii TaxID=4956 RepID=C5E001_ZYGRC|nr:uncharacterized protein ZYRO0G08558g [Zygosaccharomyces rouxii]KAH9202429.1 TLD-domain-containing protein [Zygosaccharomyces rouxii]GAV50934.1 hypothetical protein ZYGR_0AD01170 [Zygosaccharomyces rouxii]CAR29435.1 ZYRO0G08558p [Zygosaccharomyces rouxii]
MGAFSRLKKSWSQSNYDTLKSRNNGGGPSKNINTHATEPNLKNNLDNDEDVLPPITLNGYSPGTKRRLLTPEMCDEIRTLMPTRIQLYTDWNLLYSLEQHGSSLQSLYHNVTPKSKSPMRVGYVLVIKDSKQGIFGAYSNEPFHPTSDRRYYGNGECFLWKMEKVPNLTIGCDGKTKTNIENGNEHKWQFRGYPFTGLNEFAIYCQSDFLSMGAGDGHYGLWCDDNLFHGVSNPSLTYGNDVLSREGNKFHITALEVWKVG